MQPMELWPAQVDVVTALADERNLVAVKSRQVGWTTLVAGFCVMLALTEPGISIGFVSKKEDDAKVVIEEKILPGLARLPDSWAVEYSSTTKAVRFANGSKIEVFPAKNPGRSRTIRFMVVDEMAWMESQATVLSAARPASETGKLVLMSTSNGPNDLFNAYWDRGDGRDPKWTRIFRGWTADPSRDQEWYDAEFDSWSKSMAEFYREYPSTAEEAFKLGGATFFVAESLEAQEEWVVEPTMSSLAYDGNALRLFNQGDTQIFELPDPQLDYAIGADVAMGVAGGDYSSFHVVSKEPRRVVAKGRMRWDFSEFSEILNNFGHFYNQALVAVEANNHGASVLQLLLDTYTYPNLYTEQPLGRKARQANRKARKGFWTTATKKRMICDQLLQDLNTGTIWVRSAETLLELGSFMQNEDGTLFGRPHDDDVISLAIANHAARLMKPSWRKKTVQVVGTDDWVRSQMGWWEKNFPGETPLIRVMQ